MYLPWRKLLLLLLKKVDLVWQAQSGAFGIKASNSKAGQNKNEQTLA
jgi:hypothetical protein